VEIVINSFFVHSLIALTLTPAASATFATEDPFQAVEITTTRAADGIYMLGGKGGNIGVSVGVDGIFLIDDQFAPLTKKIRAAIAELTDKPVKFVLNTHWHPDHTGGNENLGETGAVIVSHDNVRKRLSVDNFIKMFNMHSVAMQPNGLPVITFNDAMTFHFNGDAIAVRHVARAHTDGDSIVHFHKANVIHTGDTCFSGMYPFIDTDSGGTVQGYIDAVSNVVELADDNTVIIPGHGPITNRKELAAWRDMLNTVSGRITAGIRKNTSLDAMQAAKPTAEFDAQYGGGFIDNETFVEMLYENLAQGDS
jgi:glyoxylase-like metal-dependent hydrolase (beta-lactamase superfamily II)